MNNADTLEKSNNWRYIFLFAAAVLWGFSFVAQATDKIPEFTFTSVRFFLGAIVLTLVSFCIDGIKKKRKTYVKFTKADTKTLLLGGLCCGIALSVAATVQQFGLTANQEAGKAGFITAMYIVLVPVLGLFIGKRTPLAVWISVALGVGGLFLICVKKGFSINKGDYYLIACAVAYAVHILVVDYFTNRTDGVKLSCLQFAFCAVVTAIAALIFERGVFTVKALTDNWMPIAYLGVFSCAGGYTFQVVGQRGTRPSIGSLIMSFESCFALLFGAIVLRERLTLREGFGCALMFVAITVTKVGDIFVKKLVHKKSNDATSCAESAGQEQLIEQDLQTKFSDNNKTK